MNINASGIRFAAVLSFAGVALVFAACGGSSAPSIAPGGAASAAGQRANTVASTGGSPAASSGAATTDRDACRLVTREDATAALGQPVNEAEVTYANAGKSDCKYISVGNYGATVLYVQTDYSPRARAVYDLAKQVYSAPQAVPGLGDAAFAVILGAPSVQVHFVKGDAYVTVVITNVDDAGRLEKAKEAAKKAAGRL